MPACAARRPRKSESRHLGHTTTMVGEALLVEDEQEGPAEVEPVAGGRRPADQIRGFGEPELVAELPGWFAPIRREA